MVRDGGVVLRGFARRRELSHGDERVRFQPAVAHGPRDADARVQTSIGGVELPKANQTVTRHAKRLTLDTARDGADVVRLGGDVLEREDGFAVTPGPEGTLRVAESPLELGRRRQRGALGGDLTTHLIASRGLSRRRRAGIVLGGPVCGDGGGGGARRGDVGARRGSVGLDGTADGLVRLPRDALALDGAEEGGLASAAPKELGGAGGLGRGRAAVLACFSGRGAVHGERGDAGRVARRAAADAQTAREKHGGGDQDGDAEHDERGGFGGRRVGRG